MVTNHGRNSALLVLSGIIGTTIEWYDLFIFSFAAIFVFDKVFFSDHTPFIASLLSLLTFASAYLSRFLGAVVFGHFGDRLGRKIALPLSLMMMGGCTCLIGVLPGAGSIGVAAPVALVVLRLLQGFAIGGDWGGAVLLAVENAQPHRRNFYGSLIQIGVPAGTVLASLAFITLRSWLDAGQMLAFGWRIPFLLSAVLVVIGVHVRSRLKESAAFQDVAAEHASSRAPFLALMKGNWRHVVLGSLAVMSIGSTYMIMSVFALKHASALHHVTASDVRYVFLVACLACCVALPLCGRLADRIGGSRLILMGAFVEIVVMFPAFSLIDRDSLAAVFGASLLMMAGFALNFAPVATFLAGLFPAETRYTGVSVCYMSAGILGSALTPVATEWLFHVTGSDLAVCWYGIVCSVVSLAALGVLRVARFAPPSMAGTL